MKSLLIIILILLFFGKSQNNNYIKYSITSFINYLQNSKVWEILEEVKIFYGADVSIQLCEEYFGSPHCEEIVRVYLTRGGTRGVAEYDLNTFLKSNNYLIILEKNRLNQNNQKGNPNIPSKEV